MLDLLYPSRSQNLRRCRPPTALYIVLSGLILCAQLMCIHRTVCCVRRMSNDLPPTHHRPLKSASAKAEPFMDCSISLVSCLGYIATLRCRGTANSHHHSLHVNHRYLHTITVTSVISHILRHFYRCLLHCQTHVNMASLHSYSSPDLFFYSSFYSIPVSTFSIPFLYQSFFLYYFYSSFMRGNLQA